MDINTGVSIILNRWLGVRRGELILLVTDEAHEREAEAFDRWARGADAVLKTLILPRKDIQEGGAIEAVAPLLRSANVIIGATDYSFITTRAVTEAVRAGARFLSLPLSCSDGTSLLENEFIGMDPAWTRRVGARILRVLNPAEEIRVTTALGTDLTFRKRGRTGGCYCGQAEHRGIVSSASFEVYIPIEERETEGRLVLDGSLGYLGLVSAPLEISFRKGRLSADEASPDGAKLLRYMRGFRSANMFQAAEFGIGLNSVSRCRGVSYIEDESTYHTFHIGMGRNITLGGVQEAAGHFDIVTHRPTITADGTLIMKDGDVAV